MAVWPFCRSPPYLRYPFVHFAKCELKFARRRGEGNRPAEGAVPGPCDARPRERETGPYIRERGPRFLLGDGESIDRQFGPPHGPFLSDQTFSGPTNRLAIYFSLRIDPNEISREAPGRSILSLPLNSRTLFGRLLTHERLCASQIFAGIALENGAGRNVQLRVQSMVLECPMKYARFVYGMVSFYGPSGVIHLGRARNEHAGWFS
ncbi:hypothetical protein KM043_002145 [Ampulex compressa]|nr:hypothetical protein KM043_002145 [Ampulex compressa]